jgi:hypothetical protein
MKTKGIAILVLLGVALIFWAASLANNHASKPRESGAIHAEHLLPPARLDAGFRKEGLSSPAAAEVTFLAISGAGAPIGNVIITEMQSGSDLGSTSDSGTVAVPRSNLPYDHLGRVGVMVSHDDYASELVYLDWEQDYVQIVMRGGGSITVYTKTDMGSFVGHQKLKLMDPSIYPETHTPLRQIEQADPGPVVISGLKPGILSLIVDATGFATRKLDVFVASNDNSDVNVTVKATPGVNVIVLDNGNRKVASADVRITDPESGLSSEGRTTPNGDVTISNVPEDIRRIRVRVAHLDYPEDEREYRRPKDDSLLVVLRASAVLSVTASPLKSGTSCIIRVREVVSQGRIGKRKLRWTRKVGRGLPGFLRGCLC